MLSWLISPSAFGAAETCYAFADNGDWLVRIDNVDGVNGSPSATALPNAAGVFDIEGIVLSLDSQTLYAADADQFGTLDLTTGVYSNIGSFGTAGGSAGEISLTDVDGLAIDPLTGVFYGVHRRGGGGEDLLFQINPATGSHIPDAFGAGVDYVIVATGANRDDVDDISIDDNGQMYGVAAEGGSDDRLIQIDKATGAVTIVGTFDDGDQVEDMEGFSTFNDGVLYGTTGQNASDATEHNRLWLIDEATGNVTEIIALPTSGGPGGDYEGVACLTGGANTIEGTVFADDDEDGVQNGGEAGYAGATVRLYIDENNDGQVDGGDTLIQTQVTDANGDYAFEVAIAGNFVVDIDTGTLPPGGTMTTDNVEEADFTDYGNTDSNNDFGFKPPPLLGIGKTASTPGPVGPGDTVTYTVVVTNNDAGNITDVTLSDVLPSAVTYAAQSTSATWKVNYLDQFTQRAYNNSHGSAPWGGSWVETEDNGGGATGGEIQVTADGWLRLQDLDTNGGGASNDNGVERSVDLSVADPAQPVTLTWDWRRDDGNESVRARLLVSGSWVEIDSTGTSGASGSESHTLTVAQLAGTTAIRFVSDSGNWGGSERIDIDNVKFAFAVLRDNIPAGTNADLDDGAPPNLVTSADAVNLGAGDALTVTYQVTVDELFNGTVELTNTATANSNENGPESGSVTLGLADYGDAPVANYGSVNHVITAGLYIGEGVDGDGGDFDSALADGDDGYGSDDDSGVAFYSPGGGDRGEIYADVSVVNDTGADAYVCAWMDRWNASGTPGGGFEGGDAQDAGPLCQVVPDNGGTAATTTFHWSGLPEAAGATFARFRVCSTLAECNAPTGSASDGEVEDYPVSFDFSPTLATIGEVSLEETTVAELLGELSAEGADLLALLAVWDPDLAASLDGADAATIEAALAAYLDPDGDGAVALLRWDTLEERGTVGFYAERRTAGENTWQRLNGGLLRGLVDAPLGGEYWLADPAAQSGETYSYRLIEQEAWGTQHRHGPWQLSLGQTTAGQASAQPAARQGRTQRGRAAAQRRDRDETQRWGEWQSLGAGFGARKRLPDAARAAPAGLAATTAAPVAATAAADPLTEALWLHTPAEGLYRIPVPELAARTIWKERQLRRWLHIGKRMALSNAGSPVAWHYDAPSDSLLFVAEPYRSIHSDENAYRLFRHGASSRVMAVQGGAGPAPGTPGGAFRERRHFEQDNVYSLWSVHDDPQADYWFWDYLYGGFKDRLDIALALPDALLSGQGELRIALRGWTDLAAGDDHRVRAELNGTPVGSAIEWDGFDQALLAVLFDQNLLAAAGDNTLTLVSEYGPDENPGQWLDRVEIDYWRAPLVRDGQLWLHDLAAGTHTVGALNGAAVYLIEAPLSAAPIWREDFSLVQAPDGSWQLTFEASAQSDYLVVETAALEDPRLSADLPSALSSAANQADYLIIAPRALSATAEALRDYRSTQFPQIQIAWLDDIYQEFSAGRVDPAAIGAFLARVRQAWSGVPDFLTLLGKGTLDHKDRQGYGDSLLPLPMVLTPWGLAGADNPSVDTDGDALMDFSYARLPVSTESAGLDYLAKLEAYEAAVPGAAAFRAVLGADNPDGGGDFALNVELLGEELQGYGYQVDIHLHTGLRAAFTASPTWEAAFVGYDGHGSATQLGNSSEDFLLAADVPELNNVALPVFSALTCAVGDDSRPGTVSLGAALVLSANGGAIAALAPTGLSLDADAQVIGSAFAAELLDNRSSIGEAARQAQAQGIGLVSPFMLGIYQVIGEPAVGAQ